MERLFNELKKKLLHDLEAIDAKGFAEKQAYFRLTFETLERLALLANETDLVEESSEAPEEKTQNEVNLFPDLQWKFEESSKETPPVFRFERKLKGGILPTIGQFVPESMVRSIGLHHGDLVEFLADPHDHKNHQFALYEKIAEEQPNRAEITRAILERNELGYSVSSFIGLDRETHLIRYSDGSPLTLRIRESDVHDYHLREGDRVDVAYYRNNLSSARVIWRQSGV
ncbi:hypothetical protein [Aureibacillus halotolerans]|uniref:Uncharacterized protein n=1 Tax=Aureibacillus halotolerans TaxID=1508390 RepID=A0A4R6UIC0_9BACI|nr:hypothetical protein [Aureibacillus halotolerans]TDQ42914.1 hypothetical protein EV213_101344 [Aureibacillus halotolerans]